MAKCLWNLGLCQMLWAVAAQGEEPVSLKYQFRTGQTLRYEGKQSMKVESTVSGTTQMFSSETSSTREWKVLELREDGSARLAMTIVRVRVEAISPDGKKIQFDSEQAGGSGGALGAMVGKPLVQVTLSPLGKILDIGQTESAAAGQFVAHIRTLLFPLPAAPVAAEAAWDHELLLPLPPPVGQGEQVRIRQAFRLEKVANSVATINLKSAPAEEIKDKALMTRLAQFLPSGRIELDLERGVLRSLELTLDQKVSDFAGTDSVMHVTGSYREVLQQDVAEAERNLR